MKKNHIIMSLVLFFGILIGVSLSNYLRNTQKLQGNEQVAEKKPLFYRNPMDPSITSDVPAKDHMGMDYIPVYADDNSAEKKGTVKIDPVIEQNIGVRTTKAVRKSFSKTISAIGKVDFNEEKIARIHPKVDGWIEDVYIDKTGQKIKQDEILLDFYSPILVTAQQEYLLALKNLENLKSSSFPDVKKGAEDVVKSSLERLRLIDVPEHQIKELEESKQIKKSLHIHSPFAGTVTKIGAREGQHITPKTQLYEIVDLSSIWVYAEIYENDVPWVNVDDKVTMSLKSVPGVNFGGRVVYIYPYSEQHSRTTKVRIVFDNQDGLLRPNMFADLKIFSKRQENAIVIPAEAIIRSGNSEQVFVVREAGKYEPRTVDLGVESNGEVAVLSGIKEGEEIVTSAQFLVDSESKLREAAAKMQEAKKDIHEHMDHAEHQTHASPKSSNKNIDGMPPMNHSEHMKHEGHNKHKDNMEHMSDSNQDHNDHMDHSEHMNHQDHGAHAHD